MDNKEEKIEEQAKEEVESDFADDVVIPQPVEEEKKEEEKQPEIQLIKDEPEEEKVEEKKNEPIPEITEEDLKSVEDSRLAFYKGYKKKNTIKTIITGAILAVILAGWILPATLITDSNYSTLSTIISFGVTGLGIVGLAVYSHFFRKKTDEGIRDYFKEFYSKTFQYAFSGTGATNFEGELDKKLDPEEFKKCKFYKDVYKVGTRYFSTFDYNGISGSICDCAAQTKGAKQLQTIYVGKFMYMDNEYDGTGLYIYIKGGKRAIPPNNINAFPIIEDNTDFVICGDKRESKHLTPAIRTAIKKIKTNKTLVDVAIAIQPGRTYLGLGYEDNLMVIPLESKLDPRPFAQFKEDMKTFLNLGELLSFKKKKEKVSE